MTKRRLALLHVVLPLVVGVLAYVVFRRGDIRLFSWARTLGLEDVVTLVRRVGAPVRDVAPRWVSGSLPDGAWAYAFGCALALGWRGAWSRGALVWLAAGMGVTAFLEIGQAVHVVPGVFDAIDLVAMMGGYGLGALVGSGEPRSPSTSADVLDDATRPCA